MAKKPFDAGRPLGEVLAELQEHDDPGGATVDEYVGKTPAQIEEQDAMLAAQMPQTPDQNSALEREVRLLKEQLAANMEFVQKLAADRGGYSTVAREAALQQAAIQRRELYERIRATGGLCTILIHTHEDPAQNWDVPVGVNGDLLFVRRGEPTVIPVEHLEVLDNAMYDHWVKELDSDQNPRRVHYQRLSYPYSLLDYQAAKIEVPRAAA